MKLLLGKSKPVLNAQKEASYIDSRQISETRVTWNVTATKPEVLTVNECIGEEGKVRKRSRSIRISPWVKRGWDY